MGDPTPLHESHPWTGAAVQRDGRARVYHPVDVSSFKKGMRQLAAAVTVVTSGDGQGARIGFTATAVCSVSAEPPQLLVCVNRKGLSCERVAQWGVFCVNVLSSAQQQIARSFGAAPVGATEDRFDVGDWGTLVTGAPMLKGCPVNFDCTVVQRVEAGTHSIFIGTINAVSVIAGLEPLAFVDGQYLTLNTARRVPDAELWDWS
ncbi:MAG TPA: flavin reductase family protein [Burkholderiales bacterium]|nr:flavin reductase family protein [Burkholderiales bacterium]